MDVFGRPADYDTSHDTLVRVQVSQLRKKLQEHFSEEGRDEPLIIEIPKGNYVPVFRPRAELLETAPAPAPYLPPPVRPRRGGRTFALGIAAGMLVMGLAWWISGSSGSPPATRASTISGASSSATDRRPTPCWPMSTS